jgi:alcohol dehydrogenase (cytochrome c)
MVTEGCNIYFASPKKFVRGETYYNTGTKLPPHEPFQKLLLALSVKDGKPVWRYPQVGHGDSWAGTLATAGGLVFFGDDAGSLEAVDASSGKALWHFNTGQSLHASPMSYAVDGIQYVAISAGSDVFSFALPH